VTSITLINPPQPQLKEPLSYVPLGIAYLAATCRGAGHKVNIANLAGMHPDAVSMDDIPLADWYGISCVTPTYPAAKKVAKLIRSSGGQVIIGGIHPTIMPEQVASDTGCYVVTGEAENVLPEMIEQPKFNHPSITRAGIVQDLDSLPLPARDLFDEQVVVNRTGIHTSTYKGSGEATTILTSRGCPYNCAYCSKIPQTSQVRLRSPMSIVREMLHIQDTYGVYHYRFPDDMFTVSKRRVNELCNILISQDIEAYWMCITRLDSLESKLLQKMHKAGCVEISCGVESGSQRMLDAMNKGTTVKHNEHGIKMIKDAGIAVKEFLMFGFPGENAESIEQTKEFVRRTQPDKVTMSTFVPLPGSDVFRNPEKYGIVIRPDWEEYYFYWDEGQSARGFPYAVPHGNIDHLIKLRGEMQDFINEYRDGVAA
tara:strand:+ start:9118 stop:10395 length:1278 start_codon:yes stop_codon:yes gene_type:complete